MAKSDYYQKNAEVIKANRRAYVKSMQDNDPRLYLHTSAKHRAKRKGVTFSITVEDIVIPTHCPILGIELSFGGSQENSPSLDKINNSLGYVPGNVQVISYRANRIKK